MKEQLISYIKQDLLKLPSFKISLKNEPEIKENIITQEQLFNTVVDFLEEEPHMTRIEIAEELNWKYPQIHIDSRSLGWLLSSSIIKNRKKWGESPVYYLESWSGVQVEDKSKEKTEIDILHDLYTKQLSVPSKEYLYVHIPEQELLHL